MFKQNGTKENQFCVEQVLEKNCRTSQYHNAMLCNNGEYCDSSGKDGHKCCDNKDGINKCPKGYNMCNNNKCNKSTVRFNVHKKLELAEEQLKNVDKKSDYEKIIDDLKTKTKGSQDEVATSKCLNDGGMKECGVPQSASIRSCKFLEPENDPSFDRINYSDSSKYMNNIVFEKVFD